MSPDQKNAILDVVTGKIDDSGFFAVYGIAPTDLGSEVLRLLKEAAATQDGEVVELALLLGAHFATPPAAINSIHELLVQTWHTSHEQMIRLLQDWGDPASVSSLNAAIQLKPRLGYLDYDDYGAFYQKCLWALAAIGTSEAVSVIREYTTSEDSVLREHATYRLAKLIVPISAPHLGQ